MGKTFCSRLLYRTVPAMMLVAASTACASPRPTAYSGLASSPVLRANSGKSASNTPYRYARPVNFRRYYKAIVEPVQIYDGPDAQFTKLSPREQEQLADYMQQRFDEELRKVFELTERAGPSTLRIRLTLTGATPTKAILGPLSRFDLAGGAYNAYQGIKGREGTMTGSVIYAVEVYDSADDSLLLAEITKQYPNAMNVGASFGVLKAPMLGIEKGAAELREKLSVSQTER